MFRAIFALIICRMASGGGIPEIGVRLSASGVQDIISAFQRVRQEGQTTGVETSASMELINASLATMGTLLPAISFAVLAGGLASVVTGAVSTATSLDKLSQKTGVSVGMLSVLNLAAKETGTYTDVLSNALGRLARGSADAADGSAKQAKAMRDLGISIQDINTKNPGELFVEIAAKLQTIESPGKRAQAVMALFGKAGLALIPTLDRLGTEGFDALQAKAERFGVYMGGELAENAKAAEAGLADVGLIAEGAGLQFASGLLPAVIGVTNAFADLAGGATGFQNWGKLVGHAVIDVAGAFNEIWKDAVVGMAAFDTMANKVRMGLDQLNAKIAPSASLRAQFAAEALNDQTQIDKDQRTSSKARIDYNTANLSLGKAETALDNPGSVSASGYSGGAPGTGISDQQAAKNAKAYSEYLQSLADNQLAILKLTNQIAEQEDVRHYQAGTLTVDAYYDRMEARAKAEAAAELAILQQKLAAAQALPDKTPEQQDKRLQAVAKVQTQITELGLNSNATLAAAEDNRAKAKHDNALRELDDQEKLQKAAGDTAGASQTQLQIEIQQYAELLKRRQDLTAAQQSAMVDDFAVRGAAKIGFDQNAQQANIVAQGANQQIGAVNDQATSGAITQVQAQSQILDIQRQQLAVLGPLLGVMQEQAEVSKDPAQIAAVMQLKAAYDKTATSMKNVTTAQTYLTNQMAHEGRADIEDFFVSIGDGAKTASQAFGDLANAFEQIISRMVAKLLIFYSLEALLGWVAPDSGYLKTLTAQGPFGHYDTGGWTGGKAGVAAGIVHGEEFVVKAGPAAQYRGLLEAINSGTSLPPTNSLASSSMSVSSDYAASLSDSSDGGGSGAPPIIQVINGTGQPVQQKQTTGPNGQSLTQIIIGTVQQDIAIGGKTAQQIESTYGIARGGTRRG